MTVIGDCRKKLSTAEGEVTIYSLRELEKQGIISDLKKKPYSIRVLIESLLRQKDGRLITDDDVKKFYEDHLEVLTKPEGVTVAHILAQVDDPSSDEQYAEAKVKIDAIYDELVKDPSQFGQIASEKSDCPSRVWNVLFQQRRFQADLFRSDFT